MWEWSEKISILSRSKRNKNAERSYWRKSKGQRTCSSETGTKQEEIKELIRKVSIDKSGISLAEKTVAKGND